MLKNLTDTLLVLDWGGPHWSAGCVRVRETLSQERRKRNGRGKHPTDVEGVAVLWTFFGEVFAECALYCSFTCSLPSCDFYTTRPMGCP